MTPTDRRNAFFNILGESLWGFQASLAAAATVLPLLLRRYGADDRMIGAIPALETAGWLLPQMVGVLLFTSRRNLQRNMILYHFAVITPLVLLTALLLALAPRLPLAVVAWGLLAGFALYQATVGVVGAVWMDWVAKVFGQEVRGTVMGLSFAGSSLAAALAALLAGFLIKHVPSPHVYAWLYALAGVLTAGSIAMFIPIRTPAAALCEPTVRTGGGVRGLWQDFRASLSDRNFRSYLLGRLIDTMGSGFLPFVALYYTSDAAGNLAESRIVAYGAAIPVGAAISCLLLGRLGDRHGHRLGIVSGAAGQVVALAMFLLAPWIYRHAASWINAWCVLAYGWVGLTWGARAISHTNMLLETCPHDRRAAHLTLGGLIVGTLGVIAPVLGGYVAYRCGIPVLFAGCGGLSLAATIWYLLCVRDPRVVQAALGEAGFPGMVDNPVPAERIGRSEVSARNEQCP